MGRAAEGGISGEGVTYIQQKRRDQVWVMNNSEYKAYLVLKINVIRNADNLWALIGTPTPR